MNGRNQKLERVTSVLPCAEAPLTLANLTEYILTDIWVRFRAQDGRPVLRGYIDDALDAARSSEPDKREAAAREAAQRPRTLKLFQLEGDSVSAGRDYAAGATTRSPGALHLLDSEPQDEITSPGLSADTYLRHLDPSALRYNVAAGYEGAPADLHITAADFRERYNRDVVDCFAGIFADLSRKGSGDFSDEGAPAVQAGEDLRRDVVEMLADCRAAYEAWNFARVLELCNAAAERIRAFMEAHPERVLNATPERGAVLGAARVLSVMLAPVLPVFAAGVKEFFKITGAPSFEDSGRPPPQNHACCAYRPLAAHVSEEDMQAMFAAAREAPVPSVSPAAPSENTVQASDKIGLISPDELGRVELRAGLIVSAEPVPGADKLLRLEIDLGESVPRPVLAGLREAYEPEELKGLTIACVTNLPPRETRFGISRAMLLAAGEPPAVFTAHRSVAPGERLR